MKIHVNVMPSPVQLVPVQKSEPLDIVIDRLIELDDHDLDKSVKSSKLMRIFY